jgi:hypothetical protein
VHCTGPVPDLGTRVDQAIAQALVVAFRVIVLQELANGRPDAETIRRKRSGGPRILP